MSKRFKGLKRSLLALTLANTLVGLGLGGASVARADGGATAAAAVYLKAEAVNIARQLAQNWHISYGPVVQPNGDFLVTFKNVVRYGPGGIGKQTHWVDVSGNLRTGTVRVRARGSAVAHWVTRLVENSIRRIVPELRRRFLNGGNGAQQGSGQKIYVRNRFNRLSRVAVRYYNGRSWTTKYWFDVQPGARAYILNDNHGRWIYFYAETHDGSSTWSGPNSRVSLGSRTVNMSKHDTGMSFSPFTMNFNP